MDKDQLLTWFIGAFNASIGDSGIVDEIKLQKCCMSCFSKARDSCKGKGHDSTLFLFHNKVALTLLLCCDSVRNFPLVVGSRDIQTVTSSLPSVSDRVFFNTCQNLQLCKFWPGLLSCLQPTIMSSLVMEYFTVTHDVTLLNMYATTELLRSILANKQFSEVSSLPDLLDKFYKFFQSFVVKPDALQATKILNGHYLVFLMQCTIMLQLFHCQMNIDVVPLNSVSTFWQNLCNPTTNLISDDRMNIDDVVSSFLSLCQENFVKISVDDWMELSELPVTSFLSDPATFPNEPARSKMDSIQSTIQQSAFRLLSALDWKCDDNAQTRFKHTELKQLIDFCRGVAVDPNVDRDLDLSLPELVANILLKDAREEKLLALLLHHREVLLAADTLECIYKHIEKVPSEARLFLLVKVIHEADVSSEWKQGVLQLCSNIPMELLTPIIEEHLSGGINNVLMQSDFNSQLTFTFNQLASDTSSLAEGRHVRLCLQSGVSVVTKAVTLAIQLCGLSQVMAQALSMVACVCRTETTNGNSVLVNCLNTFLNNEINGQEKLNFSSLFEELLKLKLVDPTQVLEVLLLPKLCSGDDEMLTLILSLLKKLLNVNGDMLIVSGVRLSAMLWTLLCIMDNLSYVWHGKDVITLTLRQEVVGIVNYVVDKINKDRAAFNKDISLLKQLAATKLLNRRAFMLICGLVDYPDVNDTVEEVCIVPVKIVAMKTADLREENQSLDHMSQNEIVWQLMQVLPHCDENEWCNALCFIHFHYLKNNDAIMLKDTLMFGRDVMLLLCTQATNRRTCDEGSLSSEDAQTPTVALNHCFQCFAFACHNLVKQLTKNEKTLDKFLTLVDIILWWSCQVQLFACDAEMPTVVLSHLIGELEGIIESKLIKIGGKWAGQVESDAQIEAVASQNAEKQTVVWKEVVGCRKVNEEEKGEVKHEVRHGNIRGILQNVLLSLVKYVPVNHLCSTLVNKLKKIIDE